MKLSDLYYKIWRGSFPAVAIRENIDRDLFYKYGVFRSQLIVMGSRGCPYACSYCNNSYYMKLYKGKGKYVRRRSVKNIIDEIKYLHELGRPIKSETDEPIPDMIFTLIINIYKHFIGFFWGITRNLY